MGLCKWKKYEANLCFLPRVYMPDNINYWRGGNAMLTDTDGNNDIIVRCMEEHNDDLGQ